MFISSFLSEFSEYSFLDEIMELNWLEGFFLKQTKPTHLILVERASPGWFHSHFSLLPVFQ